MTKQIVRLFAILLTLTLLLGLCACHASKPQETEPALQQQGAQVTDPTTTEPQSTEPASTDPTQTPTDPTEPTEPPYGMSEEELKMYAEYFDLEKTHRPTMAEVLAIQERTPVSDVIELIGKPHDFAPTNLMLAVQWETMEGYTCLIDLQSVGASQNAKNTFEFIFEYCVVERVIPLIELELEGSDTSEAYDEAGIFNATQKYFAQREDYLLGKASTMNNVHPGTVADEDEHKAAIAAAGIEWLRSDIVIHAVGCYESHAEAVVTETVTYREDGVEKTEEIIHWLQLGENDDGSVITVSDNYCEIITGFESCVYLPPYLQLPPPITAN